MKKIIGKMMKKKIIAKTKEDNNREDNEEENIGKVESLFQLFI